MLQINNILLTGSSGFLGSCIYSTLSKKYKVDTLNRYSGDFKLDLGIQIPCFCKSYDLIIHCAGQAHNYSQELYYKSNILGTINLLKGLEFHKPKMFLFVSSVSIYGKLEGDLIKEDDTILAKDPYGKSKYQTEIAITDWCKLNEVKLTILRLPLVVYKSPPGNLGLMISGINKGHYFNVAGGNARKSMVLAEDVSNIIIKVSNVGGIFNLTDGYHPSILKLSNLIAFQLNKPKPRNIPFWVAFILAKIGDVFGKNAPITSSKLKKLTTNLTFDDSKARIAFGWNPTSVLEVFKIS